MYRISIIIWVYAYRIFRVTSASSLRLLLSVSHIWAYHTSYHKIITLKYIYLYYYRQYYLQAHDQLFKLSPPPSLGLCSFCLEFLTHLFVFFALLLPSWWVEWAECACSHVSLALRHSRYTPHTQASTQTIARASTLDIQVQTRTHSTQTEKQSHHRRFQIFPPFLLLLSMSKMDQLQFLLHVWALHQNLWVCVRVYVCEGVYECVLWESLCEGGLHSRAKI